MDSAALQTLRDDPVDWRWKGLPDAAGVTVGTIAAQGWSLLHGDLPLPALVLREDAVQANLVVMAAFCDEHGVALAPHGKTTMSPELFARQLDAGAWAITVATAAQARVCARFGVPRILVANEVVDPAGVAVLADVSARGTDVWLLVDSAASVRAAGRAARAAATTLSCLVEIGMPDGRAGTRSAEAALAVATAVADEDGLDLRGVAGWEGHIGGDDPAQVQKRVDAYLGDVRAAAEAFDRGGLFADADEVVLSAGGSAWFDRVAAVLPTALSRPVRLVLRSGCTVSHDDGLYRRLSPFERGRIRGSLLPAIEAWGAVLSLPEPGLAIVGFGKRDVPFDIDLPLPRWHARDGDVHDAGNYAITGLNDQHAFLRGAGVADLEVGDLIGCGVSHPCTAFDKWRLLPVVDEARRVIGAVHTFF